MRGRANSLYVRLGYARPLSDNVGARRRRSYLLAGDALPKGPPYDTPEGYRESRIFAAVYAGEESHCNDIDPLASVTVSIGSGGPFTHLLHAGRQFIRGQPE